MQEMSEAEKNEIIDRTCIWLERAVIGLNLCPFAKGVHVKHQIRYMVSTATGGEELQRDLSIELAYLRDADPEKLDTTLLIHPYVFADFFDYNDFLDVADETLEEMKLHGEVQIASFHPDYQFADAVADDITNYTNRAPYPILHLLRETSVAQAVTTFPDAARIYERNMHTMRKLGLEGWDNLMKDSEK